jgi:hypothetical protein
VNAPSMGQYYRAMLASSGSKVPYDCRGYPGSARKPARDADTAIASAPDTVSGSKPLTHPIDKDCLDARMRPSMTQGGCDAQVR